MHIRDQIALLREFVKEHNLSVEAQASTLYSSCEDRGMQKGTDKTQYRELIVSDNLGHKVHDKISAGAESEQYGSDAFDEVSGRYAEYKSKALLAKELRNFFQLPRGNGKFFAPLVVTGVYNGAYKQEAIDKYSKIDHYFSIHYKERNLMVIKPRTELVIQQLTENNANRKPGATTNCNTVRINLGNTEDYEVVYDSGTTYEELI